MSYFSVKVYHQGKFGLEGGPLRYLGGETSIIDYCNEDEWSLIEVYEIVSRQSYLKKDIAVMWYKSVHAKTEEGLRMLRNDKDAMEMARIGMKDDIVELYVVHNTSEVQVDVEDMQLCQTSVPAKIGDEAMLGPIVVYKGQGVGSKSKHTTVGATVVEEVGSMSEGSCKEVKDDNAAEKENEESETSEDEDYEPKGSESSLSSDSSDGYASDHSLDFGDSDDDKEGAEGLIDVKIIGEEEKESTPTQTRTQSSQPATPTHGKEKIVGGFGDEDEGYNSENFLDIPIGDDEGDMLGKRYLIHKNLKNMSEYKWEVETLYVSREEFKDCATAYAVHSGRGLRFSKVDLERLKISCVEGCDWYAYCVKMKHEQTWQLTSCHNKHNCSRELKIGIMHAKWLSKAFLNKIADNPRIKLTTLMRKAYTKWNVELTKSKAARVRQFALDELHGTYIEQYRRLYDYCHELLKANPGSSVHLQVERPPEFASERPVAGVDLRPKFERIYVCLDACRRSFMVCRPMIGLDGCFLKTPYGGWLLIAMGWDPNDQILPIAYAVVEAETKDSWTWFLQHLCDDLGPDKVRTCTFMSDQQKGLVPTIEELLPGVDHRFCVRHLYANFRKRFSGLQLKLMMWNAAKATYLQEWERRMVELQKVDQGACNYLMEIPTKYWCRDRFAALPRCDTLVNNMCEVFNSVLVEAREKPIVSMLEDIRLYIMKHWAHNRERIESYQRDVLPRIRIKVEKQSEQSGNWVSMYAGRDRYEVVSIRGGKKKFVVNLKHHECSCRKFQLSGIPCAHAMCCIRKMCFNVDSYVADYYKKTAYVSCYQHIIFPVNGPNLWERTQHDDVLPPIYRKHIGRPKKKRAQAADEQPTRSEISREGQQPKCSYCFGSGHNKQTCPKKRKVTPNSTVKNCAGSTSKGTSRRGGRTSSRLSTKIDSSRGSQQDSSKQMGKNKRPTSQPKRKPVVTTQQSHNVSKRAKVNHSKTASAPAPMMPRVLPSPIKSVTQSQLKFMAKTPPRAWKKLE